MIKAAIFDVGGVLIENPAPIMVKHYSSALRVTSQEFENLLNPYSVEWQKGTLDEEQLWDGIAIGLLPEQKRDLWIKGFELAYREHAEMFKIIDSIKNDGIKTAILSNTEVPVMNFLKKKYAGIFHEYIFSCEVGMVKPERNIYEHAVALMSISPDEAVFIDDKEENVAAARSFGMHGIRFENVSAFKSALKKLNLLSN